MSAPLPTPTTTPRVQRRRNAAQGNTNNKSGKSALYHCNYCQKDISSRIRIKCAACPNFDLCLECFSVGAEIGWHKRDHAYRVVDNLSFPIFEPSWRADEELLLLEAVDMFGPNNWTSVSEHVATKKEQECKDHYFKVYIEHDDHPLPRPTEDMLAYEKEAPRDEFGRQAVMKTPDLAQRQQSRTQGMQRNDLQPSGFGCPPKQEHMEDPSTDSSLSSALPALRSSFDVPKSPSAFPKEPKTEQEQDGLTSVSPTAPGTEMARHQAAVEKARMHGRSSGAQASTSQGHLETHCTNAKALTPHSPRLQSTSQTAAPGSSSVANPVEVTGYNLKRKEFDPEYDQDAEQIIADLEFHENDSEEERERKLKMLRIYNMRQDMREKRKAQILEMGLLDVRGAEASERKMEPAELMLHSQLRVFARFHNKQQHEALVKGLAIEHHLRARIQALQECRRAGIRKLVDAEEFEQRKLQRLDTTADRPMTSRSERAARTPARDESGTGIREVVLALQPGKPTLLPAQAMAALQAAKERKPASMFDGCNSMAALLNWRTDRGLALDVSSLPGVESLSQIERKLCSSIRLTPVHYLAAKDQLIRHSVTAGHVTRRDARSMLRMDAMKVARIHELLLKLGSIRAYPDFQNDLAARTSVTPCPSTASTLQTQWTVALHGSQA